MSNWKFDGTEDQIDSREIIERIEELNEKFPLDFDEHAEHVALLKLASEAESSPDWAYGEQLISDSYFIEYTEQLIDDCYPEVSKALASSAWPMTCLKMDYELAARVLKFDYFDVTFNGSTYWIRG